MCSSGMGCAIEQEYTMMIEVSHNELSRDVLAMIYHPNTGNPWVSHKLWRNSARFGSLIAERTPHGKLLGGQSIYGKLFTSQEMLLLLIKYIVQCQLLLLLLIDCDSA